AWGGGAVAGGVYAISEHTSAWLGVCVVLNMAAGCGLAIALRSWVFDLFRADAFARTNEIWQGGGPVDYARRRRASRVSSAGAAAWSLRHGAGAAGGAVVSADSQPVRVVDRDVRLL